MFDFFQRHPHSVGETYLEHMAVAATFGVLMILGGLACLVHAVLPEVFVNTASRVIAHLHARMVTHRRRKSVEIDYAI